MLQDFFQLLGRIYTIFWSLVITVVLAAVTWLMWYMYQAERFDNKFNREGKLVNVQITEADRNPRMFLDRFGNAVYVRFNYHDQTYETRCINDTTWLSEGDRIKLLYHPGLNQFQQPSRLLVSTSTRVVSRLVRWSVIPEFSQEHKLLGGFILALLALLFFGGGVITTLTGWAFIQTLARFTLIVTLGGAALFFTYDTTRYFQYVQALRTNGRDMEVSVTDVDRMSRSRKSKYHWYTYNATFPFQGQNRVVAVESDDYERLKGGNKLLRVRYNASLNDFIAVEYSPDFMHLLTPLFFWFLFILLIRNSLIKPKATPV